MKQLTRIYLDTLGVPSEGDKAPRLSGAHKWMARALVLAAVPILVVVNLVTLMFGVSVGFLGRDGVRFSFLRLWGRVRAIYVMLPVMIAYGVWHKLQAIGVFELVSSMAATIVAAIAAMALVLLLNGSRARP